MSGLELAVVALGRAFEDDGPADVDGVVGTAYCVLHTEKISLFVGAVMPTPGTRHLGVMNRAKVVPYR